MNTFKRIANKIFRKLLSKKAKLQFENFIFVAAFIGFTVHLGLIFLLNRGVLAANDMAGLSNPIDALYTPFSIILFYEVYCLIYYLPKSITVYIGKQFEIITLIGIREIFDELANLQLSSDVNAMLAQPDFIYSMGAILVLFGLIFIFYRINQRHIRQENNTPGIPRHLSGRPKKYVYAKHLLALCVGVLFMFFAFTGLYDWITGNATAADLVKNSKPATKSFFENFFMILILSDVIVLLFSFAVTDKFHKVMRNSGFVISTTLLKLSFTVEGLAGHLMVIAGVAFGTAILAMYKLYDKIELPED